MRRTFAGAWPLLRSSWRHSRATVLAWASIGVLFSLLGVGCYDLLFPDPSDVASMETAVVANPAISLVMGPAADLSTRDGFGAWLNVGLGAFFLAIGMAMLVVRSSRGQEDDGQAELFASGVLGRGARLAAAAALGIGGSLVAGLLSAVVAVLCGGTWGTQLLVGAILCVTGWMGTGIAAVAAQLGSDKHTADTLAVGALGVLYVLRGFCYALDLPEWTIWANPMGWMAQANPVGDERWWPLLPGVALAVVLLTVAVVLQGRRDFAAGALTPAPGPGRGRVRSVGALTWRLNRSNVLTWVLVFVVFGVMFGYFMSDSEDTLATNPAIQELLQAGGAAQSDLTTQMLVTVLTVLGVLAAVPAAQGLFKLRSEETADRVEPVLATGVSRTRLFGSTVGLALAATTVELALAGLLVGVIARAGGVDLSLGDVLAQTAATLPAVWTFLAIAAAFAGLWPRGRALTWVAIMASFLLTILGPMMQLSDAVLSISPFHHVPAVADADPSWTGLVVVGAIDVVLLVVGFLSFRRRDVNA